jgi:hypothetical protein
MRGGAGRSARFEQRFALGGILAADDTDHHTAFKDFASGMGNRPIVVDGRVKLIGVLRKPDPE